jgi:phosphoserine phosphatase
MSSIVFDLKGILMPNSCIEEFGKDFTLYNIRSGSANTFSGLTNGLMSAIAKNFGNGYAYRFANYAFRGAPKGLVEECSEKYRKLVPSRSKGVVRKIKDLGLDVGVITHDVNSLCLGVYDEFGISLDNVKDNDFSFKVNQVSGVVLDQDGWPRVHDKAYALRDYMLGKGYHPKDIVLVGHGCEEISMARMVKNRIIVPENGSCRRLKDTAMGVYEHLESLPKMIEIAFK